AEVTTVEMVFGNVSWLDMCGNPMKTFAYINIGISEADLKRCMSILNKTRWKGGTLQIELAKESFLHRIGSCRPSSIQLVHRLIISKGVLKKNREEDAKATGC
uniref:RRM domain-containing protein n=1 Tax=Terrapene triunguis TaxID=2587831 RepID=A0A674HTP4_9SAUR